MGQRKARRHRPDKERSSGKVLGKVKEELCRSGPARTCEFAAYLPSCGLESEPASGRQRSLRLPTLEGSQQEEGRRKKEEGIPPAEAAHHDVSADHPEAAW